MKRILTFVMVFILVLSVPLTALADRPGQGTSSEGTSAGGYHLGGDRESHGFRPGFPSDLTDLLPEDATYYDYFYVNYKENGSKRDSYALSVKGNGRFRYRTMNYVYKGGTSEEQYHIYLIVLSPLPFDVTLARVEINLDNDSYGQPRVLYSGEVSSKSNLAGKAVYMFSYPVFSGYGIQAKNVPYYMLQFEKASFPNYLKVPVSENSASRPEDYDWYIVESLDFILDDYGNDDFSPEGDDDLGEYGGGDGGSGTGGGGGGSGTGGGDGGDDNKPDFDIDFSNIFTLIYTIIKALIDFIVSCLNMLVEFATLLLEQTGQFAPLIGSIFTFLPEEFITMILSGIVIIILIGIVKK